jgi:hypothetical protein
MFSIGKSCLLIIYEPNLTIFLFKKQIKNEKTVK